MSIGFSFVLVNFNLRTRIYHNQNNTNTSTNQTSVRIVSSRLPHPFASRSVCRMICIFICLVRIMINEISGPKRFFFLRKINGYMRDPDLSISIILLRQQCSSPCFSHATSIALLVDHLLLSFFICLVCLTLSFAWAQKKNRKNRTMFFCTFIKMVCTYGSKQKVHFHKMVLPSHIILIKIKHNSREEKKEANTIAVGVHCAFMDGRI